jgi:hypothetical protein
MGRLWRSAAAEWQGRPAGVKGWRTRLRTSQPCHRACRALHGRHHACVHAQTGALRACWHPDAGPRRRLSARAPQVLGASLWTWRSGGKPQQQLATAAAAAAVAPAAAGAAARRSSARLPVLLMYTPVRRASLRRPEHLAARPQRRAPSAVLHMHPLRLRAPAAVVGSAPVGAGSCCRQAGATWSRAKCARTEAVQP